MVKAAALVESAESLDPASSTGNIRSCRSVVEYQLIAPTLGDLADVQTLILGTTASKNPSSTDGRLKRTLPLNHPIYRYRYASNIAEVRGSGVPVQKDAAAPTTVLFPTGALKTSLYPEYTIKVEFTPRLYNFRSDDAINLYPSTDAAKRGSWWTPGGAHLYFSYCDAWKRFTDFELAPKDDGVTAQMGGGMKFKTAGAAFPDGQLYAGMGRIRMPNQSLKITWFQIPYRYVTGLNSYVTKYLGYINQNDWWNWKAGQLLYVGYNPIRYQHPQPELSAFTPGDGQTPVQLCDLELFFLLTSRTATDAPGVPGTLTSNAVPAGHNLLPFFGDFAFHYALTTAAAPAPFWPSFPAEILFWDPDLPHLAGL